ncbi:MAG: lysylphosphatidylglycerol synthase transmembrane domain-containing protein [Candidatus Woesearchaeota archaeon]
MNKKLVILMFVLGLVVSILFFYFTPLEDAINNISSASIPLLFLFFFIQLLMHLILTYRWGVVLASQGVRKVSFFKLSNYVLAGHAVSFFTPSAKLGGEPVKALLLSREKISFEKSLSSVVIDKTIELTCSGLFFFIGVILLLFGYVLTPGTTFAISIISLFFLLIVVIFNYRVMRGKRFFHPLFKYFNPSKAKWVLKFEKKLKDFEKLIVKFYHKDKSYFIYVFLLTLLSWALMFIEYSVAVSILGLNLGLLELFLIISFMGAAYLFPVPMAVGSLEASQVGVFKIIGLQASFGLALALLIRLKDIILAFLGVIVLFFYGFKSLSVFSNERVTESQRKKVIKKI